jgi:predicted transcriptional regulator
VSTLIEIQDAIGKLPKEEKSAVSLWLNSQSIADLAPADEERLLRSLDEAIRDIDAGKGVPLEEVRKRVTSWAAK